VTGETDKKSLNAIEFGYSHDILPLDTELQGFPLLNDQGILFPLKLDSDDMVRKVAIMPYMNSQA
jgi:hypothetical protein